MLLQLVGASLVDLHGIAQVADGYKGLNRRTDCANSLNTQNDERASVQPWHLPASTEGFTRQS